MDFVDAYFEEAVLNNANLTAGTIKTYRRAINHIKNFLASRKNSAIRLDEIDFSFASDFKNYLVLRKDATAILEFDPAAQSIEEVIVAYPGFYATAIYRMCHQLWVQGITFLPRLFTELRILTKTLQGKEHPVVKCHNMGKMHPEEIVFGRSRYGYTVEKWESTR